MTFDPQLLKIASLVLYVFWALGNSNVTIWHWIIPFVIDVLARIVVEMDKK